MMRTKFGQANGWEFVQYGFGWMLNDGSPFPMGATHIEAILWERLERVSPKEFKPMKKAVKK